jgi:hypothetical protein
MFTHTLATVAVTAERKRSRMREQIIRGRFKHRCDPAHVDRVVNAKRAFGVTPPTEGFQAVSA